MKKNTTLKGGGGLTLLLTLISFFAACDKDQLPTASPPSVRFADEAARGALAELNLIARVILQEVDVRQEVYALAKQPRHVDLYVDLDALLNPEAHPADEFVPVPTRGAFRRAFDAVYDAGTYPMLAAAITPDGLSGRSGFDGGGMYVYCPYCESYSDAQLRGGFSLAVDTLLDDPQIVPGTAFSTTGSGKQVAISDDYALANPSLLLIGTPDGGLGGGVQMMGGGGDDWEIIERCTPTECCEYRIDYITGTVTKLGCYPPNPPTPPTPPTPPPGTERWSDCVGDDAVWTGWIQIKDHKLDGIFAGGPEIRLSRSGSDNAVQLANGHIEINGNDKTDGWDFKRSDTKDGKEHRINTVFDINWDCGEAPQNILMWEDDDVTEKTRTFDITASAKFKVSIPGKIGETEFNPGTKVSFSKKVFSNDPILFQEVFNRDEFFRLSKRDRGSGFKEGWTKYRLIDGGYMTLPPVYY